MRVRLGKAIKREQELCNRHLVGLLEAHTVLGSYLCNGHLVGLLEAHTKGATTQIQST